MRANERRRAVALAISAPRGRHRTAATRHPLGWSTGVRTAILTRESPSLPMKISLPSFAVAAFFALVTSHAACAADKAGDATRALMQEKLKEAQSVLGSVATGDFGALEKSAKHLVELSNRTNWYSRQTPEYDLFLNGFRRNAEGLVKAAADKNLDAASLAFVQLTLSCVSCHKYLRVAPTAGLDQLDLSKIAQAGAVRK